VIYEEVELDSRTPLTIFFSLSKEQNTHFLPTWQILFDTTSPRLNVNS